MDPSSPERNTSNIAALCRRRSGLLAAHGALSRRHLDKQRPNESCPVLPTRELSNPNLDVSTSFHSRAFEEQDCSIPSLDLKIQTLLNLEGRKFLHSSLQSPIPPCREPSNANLCPSEHSRVSSAYTSTDSSSAPSSGHSRSSVLLEDPEKPTSIPAFDRKAQTLYGSDTSGTNCPIQPVRELSNANLCDSVHSEDALSAIPSLATMPTILSGSQEDEEASDSHLSEGDEGIMSEEETETEDTVYEDITIDHPLLGPLVQVQQDSSLDDEVSAITTTVVTKEVSALTSTVVKLTNSLARVNFETEELKALKKYWVDLGERIDAMEARGEIENCLTDLGECLDAISGRTRTKSLRDMDTSASLAPVPSEKSKSKSRSSSSSKSASMMTCNKCLRGLEKLPSLGPAPSEKSKSKSRSPSSIKSAPIMTMHSRYVAAEGSSSKQSHSKSDDGAKRRPRSSKQGDKEQRSSTRTRSVDRKRGTKWTKSSKQNHEAIDEQGMNDTSRRSQMDESGTSAASSSRRRMRDGSGSSASSRDRWEPGSSMNDTSRRSQMGESGTSAASSSRRRMRDGSGSSASSRARQKLTQSPGRRRNSGRRLLADANDSVDLRRKSSSRRLSSKSRAKLLQHKQDKQSKSETDHIIQQAQRKAASRSPGAKSLGSRSSGTHSLSSSKSPSDLALRKHRNRPLSQRPLPHFGNKWLRSLPHMVGDLDASARRDPEPSKDTMDVHWWRFYHDQEHQPFKQTPMPAVVPMGRMQSRMGKSLGF